MYLAISCLFSAWVMCVSADDHVPMMSPRNGTVASSPAVCFLASKTDRGSTPEIAHYEDPEKFKKDMKMAAAPSSSSRDSSMPKAMYHKKIMKKMNKVLGGSGTCDNVATSMTHRIGWHWIEECPEKINYIKVYWDFKFGRICYVIPHCSNRVWFATCLNKSCCVGSVFQGHCYQNNYNWQYFWAYCPPFGNWGKPWKFIYLRRLWLPHCCSCRRCVWWIGK